ncbi:hypothetical protein [Planktothrix mougeotii]|uniref:Uncharacterized protein n=1 Tax=Planktothrix mougeotii LEGE 06226 TaxID=1828728 RepID=A0ABR9UFG0_9CYAN|nr:hypothetical protein [Planktothrix mougeotii]MBE9145207.1 hypothetical protein [Planktothrix mougeotii LEGE 06226]
MSSLSNDHDNSLLSGDSQLDHLIQSLGIELHSPSHSQSADSQHFLQHLDSASQGLQTDFDQSLHHSGMENQQDFSHHSDPFNSGFEHIGIEQHHLTHSGGNHHLTDSSIHSMSDPFHHSHNTTTDPFHQTHHNLELTALSHPTEYHSQEHLSSAYHPENASAYSLEHQPQTLNYTDSGAITPSDNKSIDFSGNTVWWHGYGWGQAGTVDGHKFYRSGEYIGRLGADLNVYDADGNKIGYVTPSGNAYTPSGKLFATGDTARWAAATLVFNTCTES